MTTPANNLNKIRRILIVILLLNWIVAAAKTVFGILGNSISMIADGAHSIFDGGSNIVGLVAVTAGSKKPDHDHPYGHHKFEILGSVLIGMFMTAAAWNIVESAVDRFSNEIPPDASSLQFIVLTVTLFINLGVSIYEQRKGKEFKSPILSADSQHTRSDVFATLAVIVSLALAHYGYPVFDPIIALLLAGYVAWMAIRLILSSAQVLADRAVLDPEEINKIVGEIEGVLDCHEIRTRGVEGSIFADLRIHVAPDIPLREAHDISHNVEDALRSHFSDLVDVIVHVEPQDEHHD